MVEPAVSKAVENQKEGAVDAPESIIYKTLRFIKHGKSAQAGLIKYLPKKVHIFRLI